eukprot:CAMPEP_0179251710 /NCGR_PEP_ID=MMETSP0797-20121207/21830_1 /TAXON_ID=47934 /ORGANISM="Dinophysis acuminata, Strain DAEP01" /LENGTH=389 /DNA_ID=CAMNT_0020959499 /DNA_START=32 /DNA_END=1201 /DNA_ORIENTATION=+
MAAKQWVVVGGADKGGILVREGESVKSAQTAERLSTGAEIEEIELKGERLHYKLLTGTGPAEGWVALSVSGKTLVEEKEDEYGPPSEPGPVEVDADFKSRTEKKCAAMKGEFLDYVPKYKVFGGPLEDPKLRIVCFHNAGGAETNYTGPGTPIFKWLKEKPQRVEIIAFDYPGRQKMLKKTKHVSIDTLAPELLACAFEKLGDGVPYITWGHSVGTWVCFEFLIAARKAGLPMPKAAFFNAFPAPHMPKSRRPWGESAKMDDAALRAALTKWDADHLTGAGKVVFDEPQWMPIYEPQMRADFRLFDEYKFRHTGAPKFDFPIYAWHFEKEAYNTADMIEMWKDWTSAKFDHCVMKGMGHLTCFYKPDCKTEYFTKVLNVIKEEAAAELA